MSNFLIFFWSSFHDFHNVAIKWWTLLGTTASFRFPVSLIYLFLSIETYKSRRCGLIVKDITDDSSRAICNQHKKWNESASYMIELPSLTGFSQEELFIVKCFSGFFFFFFPQIVNIRLILVLVIYVQSHMHYHY